MNKRKFKGIVTAAGSTYGRVSRAYPRKDLLKKIHSYKKVSEFIFNELPDSEYWIGILKLAAIQET